MSQAGSSQKVKLLIGITLSEMGGAQRVVFEILRHLDEREFEVTLVTRPGGELIRWVQTLNGSRAQPIRITACPYLVRPIRPLLDVLTWLFLWKVMRKERFDVAHFHSSKMGILGRLAARAAGVPRVCFTVHGWGIHDYQASVTRWILTRIERLAATASTAIICVSRHDVDVAQRLRIAPMSKLIHIANGVDIPKSDEESQEAALYAPPDALTIGAVGRLAKPKRPDLLVRAAAELRRRDVPSFRVVFVGDGPMRPRLEELTGKLGLSEIIRFLGSREDASQLAHRFDLAVLCSEWEGLPLVVLEAMRAKKPVVATRVGGVEELIEDGLSGYLVPRRNMSALADALERLLKDANLREAMGEKGYTRSLAFSGATMAAAYRAIYRGEIGDLEMTGRGRLGHP